MIPLLFIISGLFLLINGGKTVEGNAALQWLDLLASWGLVGCYFVFSWRRGGQTMANGRPVGLLAQWLIDRSAG